MLGRRARQGRASEGERERSTSGRRSELRGIERERADRVVLAGAVARAQRRAQRERAHAPAVLPAGVDRAAHGRALRGRACDRATGGVLDAFRERRGHRAHRAGEAGRAQRAQGASRSGRAGGGAIAALGQRGREATGYRAQRGRDRAIGGRARSGRARAAGEDWAGAASGVIEAERAGDGAEQRVSNAGGEGGDRGLRARCGAVQRAADTAASAAFVLCTIDAR